MGTYRRIAGIYEILNTVNNKRYIGHSKSILKRWEGHLYHLRRGDSLHTHLQSSWNIYGENSFKFSILEILPTNLTKQEYERVETTWIEKYKTTKTEFGYNGVLPGSFPLTKDDENKTSLNRSHLNTSYICMNLISKEIVKVEGAREITEKFNIPQNKISELTRYWLGVGKIKSRNSWIVIREEDYNPEFDYINYKKVRRTQLVTPKTWRDYYNKEKHRKNPEEVMPREQRNLKRVPIIAVNIETGEETYYRMMKDCYKEFLQCKVYKCINAPFGKHQHRGYYFKRAEI